MERGIYEELNARSKEESDPKISKFWTIDRSRSIKLAFWQIGEKKEFRKEKKEKSREKRIRSKLSLALFLP